MFEDEELEAVSRRTCAAARGEGFRVRTSGSRAQILVVQPGVEGLGIGVQGTGSRAGGVGLGVWYPMLSAEDSWCTG